MGPERKVLEQKKMDIQLIMRFARLIIVMIQIKCLPQFLQLSVSVYLCIIQICEGIQNEDWEVVDPNPGSHGPYAHTKDGLWVGYDDEEIAREKVISNCEQ